MSSRIHEDILHQQGYRFTPQRHLILEVLEQAEGHLTIDQILSRAQTQFPRLPLSTVYRTLELLQELDLVRQVHLPQKGTCYEMTENPMHHHLVCRMCQRTIHLDETLLGQLHENLAQQYDFHGLRLELTVSGYCDSCWQMIQQEHSTSFLQPSAPLQHP